MISYRFHFAFRTRPVQTQARHARRQRVLATLLLLAGLGAIRLEAQDAIPQSEPNGVVQAEETITTDTAQLPEIGQEEDAFGTNIVAATNTVMKAGPDARERRLLRQRRPRSTTASQSNGNRQNDSAGTNAAASSLDYSAFRLVADRNIFDPNRSPRSSSAPVRPKAVDSFTLVGTMSYEKGVFAFFDGTSSDYKKALKANESIAGYKVIAITPDTVKLMLKTNTLELSVGTRMRRREDGTWEPSQTAASYANTANASASPSNEPSTSGAESDIIKKMMQRREKE